MNPLRPALLLALAACTGKVGGPADSAAPADTADTGAPAGDPDCDPVVLAFTGSAVTVSGAPFAGRVPRETPAEGTLGYLPCLGDREPDPGRGEYRHASRSTFTLSLGEVQVGGSGQATLEVVVAGSTWRYVDGVEPAADAPRRMTVDGAPADDLDLWISTGPADSAAFTSDAIPAPTWMDPGAPHTFSLDDAGGTVLIQWEAFGLAR